MRNYYLGIVLLTGILAGCTKFNEPAHIRKMPTTMAETRSGGAAFDSLPDPYAIANMQAVYDTYGNDNRVLQPTDLYVRVMPCDSTQLELLEDMYDLDLFDYPLDLDIPAGEEYIDPTIPEGEFGWFYTTVKPDFVFPEDIIYEILRECYIPENGETIPPTTRAGEIDVEMAAYERLGYVVEPLTRSGGGGGLHPEGYVTMRDDSGSDVPVVGIRVKVHSHTKIDKEVYTTSSGYYRTNKKFWQYNLKYTVVFINKKENFIIWRVTSGTIPFFARAKYKIEMKKEGGDIVITRDNGKYWQWAAMYNATNEYYRMCDATGITKPPHNLKILFCPAYLATQFGGSCALMARRLHTTPLLRPLVRYYNDKEVITGLERAFLQIIFEINGPDLIINAYDDLGNADTYREIYNTMHHELSHASHFSKVGVSYWEEYIRYIVNSLISSDGSSTYGDGTGQYAGNCGVGEMWGHAMGHIQECEKYNDTGRLSDPYIYSTSYPRSTYTYSSYRSPGSWIRPDPIWALITRGVLTKKQVFDCLTSDVDTRAKLIDKMCVKYPAKVPLIRLAFDANDTMNPTLTGPDNPSLNSTQTYSVTPVTNLPTGVTFNEFTVSGTTTNRTFTVSGGTLSIIFKTASLFTITAAYTLPDGSTYTCTKTIDKRIVPNVPYLKRTTTRVGVAMYHKVSITNVQQDATYEWMRDDRISPPQPEQALRFLIRIRGRGAFPPSPFLNAGRI